jgi:serine protease AprX
MKRIFSAVAITAVIGAAAFVLQTNDRMIPWATGVSDAPADSIATVKSAVAGERASSEAVTDVAVEAVAPAQDLVMADAVASFYAPDGTSGARQATAAAADERPARSTQAAAMAKMSSQVAALAASGGNAPVELIVSYNEYPELFEDGRIESLGGDIVRRYSVIEQLAVRLPANALIDLAVDESVDRLSLDETVQVAGYLIRSPSEPEYPSATLASNRPVSPSANTAFNGNYINVAMIDTGVYEHADLYGRVRQYSFLDGQYPVPDIEYDDSEIEKYHDDSLVDGYGHGTHVAGIISATGKSSGGKYSGLATGANILSLQVLDDHGQGQMSDVIAALDWLLQYGDAFDIDVVNLSLGKPVTESNTTDPLVLAAEALWNSGMVVVVAAGNQGNDGYFTVTSPGNSRKVITVGSLTDNGTGTDFGDDYVSTFSSRGPTPGDFVVKPDLVAPGNRLVSTISEKSTLADLLPERVVACTVSEDCKQRQYFMLSGTSMAAPMVSATAALMLQKDPSLTPATIKARLMRSARKYGHSPIDAGAGLLDIDAALNAANSVSGEALSPLMQQDPATGATLIQDTGVLWGDSIWGSGYLWTDGGGVNSNGFLWTDGGGGVDANGFLWTDGGIDANGFLWTDGTIDANGFLWTDGTLVANGFLWTDGGSGGGRVAANGFLWTDGGVNDNGYLWTDGGAKAATFFDPLAPNPVMLDDEHTVE